MRADNQCAWCIIHDLTGALELLPASTKTKKKILERSLSFLGKEFPNRSVPSYYITRVHRFLKEISGNAFPFRKLREKCNIAGMLLAVRVEKKAKKLKGKRRFEYLVRWTTAGNHFDFRTIGAGYKINIEKIGKKLAEIAEEKLKVDHIEEIYQAANKARHVLYIHDNIGEIALDKLLIQELLQRSPIVVSVLKGGPITSDATMEDGIRIGLDKVSTRIISSGSDTLGISWEEMSSELRKELRKADLVISKGQANFYILSGHKRDVRCPIAFLLRTKCTPASLHFGFQGQGSVAALECGTKKSCLSAETTRRTDLKTSGLPPYTAQPGEISPVRRQPRVISRLFLLPVPFH